MRGVLHDPIANKGSMARLLALLFGLGLIGFAFAYPSQTATALVLAAASMTALYGRKKASEGGGL